MSSHHHVLHHARFSSSVDICPTLVPPKDNFGHKKVSHLMALTLMTESAETNAKSQHPSKLLLSRFSQRRRGRQCRMAAGSPAVQQRAYSHQSHFNKAHRLHFSICLAALERHAFRCHLDDIPHQREGLLPALLCLDQVLDVVALLLQESEINHEL